MSVSALLAKRCGTNVLIYLASADTVKADKAEHVLDEVGGVISVQVRGEFVNVARRKIQLSWPESRDTLKSLRGILRVEPITTQVHATGLDIAERYGLSTSDAMIVASALEADCETAVVGGHAGWNGDRGVAGVESVLEQRLNDGGDRFACAGILRHRLAEV